METLITTVTDGQKKQVKRFAEDAVDRAIAEGLLDKDGLQRVIENGDDLQAAIVAKLRELSVTNKYADEEVKSNYGYPQGYAVKPVCEQLVELSKHFNGLNINDVLACSKELPALPAGAEGWFAVPRWEKVAKTYNEAVKKVLAAIKTQRKGKFYNCRKDNLGPKYLRLSERTATALQMLGEKQKGDFLLMPAQFGLTHRGRSVRRVREIIGNSNEFGLGSFAVGCMILSHPERLVQWEQLHIDCPGDEYSPDGDGVFSCAPLFLFYDDRIKFGAVWVDDAHERYGSASWVF